ncbi:hypothetical protein [Bradyrhizobium sp.]
MKVMGTLDLTMWDRIRVFFGFQRKSLATAVYKLANNQGPPVHLVIP